MTKKTVAKTKATRTRRTSEKPGDSEIRRAVEPASIPALTYEQRLQAEDAARDKLVKAIVPDLLLASELLGEELASYEDAGVSGDSSLVRSALHKVWQIRWNLGLYAGAKLPGGAA